MDRPYATSMNARDGRIFDHYEDGRTVERLTPTERLAAQVDQLAADIDRLPGYGAYLACAATLLIGSVGALWLFA